MCCGWHYLDVPEKQSFVRMITHKRFFEQQNIEQVDSVDFERRLRGISNDEVKNFDIRHSKFDVSLYFFCPQGIMFTVNKQARNSVGECYLDMVEVGGSNPPVPTRITERL